jgi:hypothetical protein
VRALGGNVKLRRDYCYGCGDRWKGEKLHYNACETGCFRGNCIIMQFLEDGKDKIFERRGADYAERMHRKQKSNPQILPPAVALSDQDVQLSPSFA